MENPEKLTTRLNRAIDAYDESADRLEKIVRAMFPIGTWVEFEKGYAIAEEIAARRQKPRIVQPMMVGQVRLHQDDFCITIQDPRSLNIEELSVPHAILNDALRKLGRKPKKRTDAQASRG